MFRNLRAAIFTEDALRKLAETMTAPHEPKLTSDDDNDDEENFGIPAGYTYFGQFVDHDITFDPTSLQAKEKDPDGLVNFRTPALDLDNLYGRGPTDQPYMYDPKGIKFRLGDRLLTGGHNNTNLTHDLPRFHERALIGDKRNDENVIVSQLHGLFLRFHNLLADTHQDMTFEQIQQLTRWHYQWLVLYDYLPRIVGKPLVESILSMTPPSPTDVQDRKPKLLFFDWKEKPFMPVEFSVAAYRFGHSMVRPVYRLSGHNLKSTIKIENLHGRKVIFSPNADDGLNGFREFPSDWGIDWHLFFETPGHPLSSDNKGRKRVQPAYKIDSSLVNPLAALPEFSIRGTNDPIDETGTQPPRKEINMLALRNLIRGNKLNLPSGQAVARLMGLIPIPDERLLVGKANIDGLTGKEPNQSITSLSDEFVGRAPLWFYILAEAQDQWVQAVDKMGDTATKADKNALPIHLGPVGGRIVAEVLIGLIWGDGTSFLAANSGFQPEFGNPSASSVFDQFTMGDLITALNGKSLDQ